MSTGSPGRRWFTWHQVSDISMSDDGVDDDDEDDVVMDYSESEGDNDFVAPPPPRHRVYATGSSAFRERRETKSSRVVRFRSVNDGVEVFDEESPSPQPPPDSSVLHDTDSASSSHRARPRSRSQQETRRRHPKKVWKAVSNLAMAVHRSPANAHNRTSARVKRVDNSEEYPERIRTERGSKPRKSVSDSANRRDDVNESERSPLLSSTRSRGNEQDLLYSSTLNHQSATPTPNHQNTTTATLERPAKPNSTSTAKTSKKRNSYTTKTSTQSSSGTSAAHRDHQYLRRLRQNRKAVEMAASFLRDFERSRRPSLPADLGCITDTLLSLCRWKYSFLWNTMVNFALVALFVSSCYESSVRTFAHTLHVYAVVVFALDMAMGSELRRAQHSSLENRAHDPLLHLRQSRLEYWTVLLAAMLFLLTMEIALSVGTERRAFWSSALKPIALFYVSNQAKNALEALNRIGRLVTRVLVMELFVILSFAAVACRLYIAYESFHDLSTAFLSLFQLSTTVVNPSMWMPMYSASSSSAFFFVFFVVTSVFYLHSLVLSVVFQTYVQASSSIHERSMTDREDAIRLAFLSLKTLDDEMEEEELTEMVRMENVRKVLRNLRPHYSPMKINALLEIMDPTSQTRIDYSTFRIKIRQALNASVRTARNPTAFSVTVELIGVLVAAVNFVYVILFTSAFHADWFDSITVWAGAVITLLGLFELTVRLNPWHVFPFTPITRLNSTFDGLAMVAAGVSLHGLFMYFTGQPLALELFLTGRAVDMIRIMRFFPMFRDVVRRSGDVFPALAGPVALVVSSIHLFTYLGMALWGGAVKVGDHSEDITPLYDLNNFNSYGEGMVTMFQVLVVNDWHAIAEVFLYATRCASPYIVYPFFVFGNLVNVSIMLNCLTAFFVGAFVTKLNDDVDAESEEQISMRNKPPEFGIQHSERNFRRMSSQLSTRRATEDDDSTASSDLYEFDVYEREGYDKIMQTVAGVGSDGADFAKDVCDILEVFESLSPERHKVGYMICCQQTMSRFGNHRFQTQSQDYIDERALHMVVNDMHAELLALAGKRTNRSLVRSFPHLRELDSRLELSASLIRHQPAVSLFVSDVVSERS